MKTKIIIYLIILCCFSSCFMLDKTNRKLYGYLKKTPHVSFVDTINDKFTYIQNSKLILITDDSSNMNQLRNKENLLACSEFNPEKFTFKNMKVNSNLKILPVKKEINIKKKLILRNKVKFYKSKKDGFWKSFLNVLYTFLFFIALALLIVLIVNYPIIAVVILIILLLLFIALVQSLKDLSFGG